MKEKKQKWIIRRYLAGMPARKIASHLQISLRTTYRVLAHYKKVGKILEQKPKGRRDILPTLKGGASLSV